ncbi:MAG TPA: hypothetical protein VKW08_27475 [Xanthobacteraceae bacterium]|nr:hypothetical protein [Xanthobacteraceae bacterium]
MLGCVIEAASRMGYADYVALKLMHPIETNGMRLCTNPLHQVANAIKDGPVGDLYKIYTI